MRRVYGLAKAATLVATSVLVLSACMPEAADKALADSPSYASETALAVVNSVATDTERGVMDLVGEEIAPFGGSCKTVNPRSSCNSANQIRYEFSQCATPTASLKGGWTNTYNNTNACMQAQEGALQSGQSVTRTSSGLTIDGYFGGKLEFNTLAHSAYDQTTISAKGITVANEGRYRVVDIAGARRTLKNSDGKVLFDVSMMTPNEILMTGTRAARNRQINAGTIRIYDNENEYIGHITFSAVKWGNSSCCYPTAGSLITSYEGSKTGTSTLQFTSTCGKAKYQDENGSTKDIELIQCE